MSGGSGWSVTVHVDAKIKGMHDKTLLKKAYVGYYILETGEHREKPVSADESDDAEIQAVLFAIEELAHRFDRMTIVCDHHSVVSEAKRQAAKNPSELLTNLRNILHEYQSRIELKALQSNLAHGSLTEYVNRLESESPAS